MAIETRHVAGYSPDLSRQPDVLDIESDIQALASLIAARRLSPPFSVGLFGHEASGKSFFLSRLRHQIERLASGSNAEAPSVHCSDIASVSYNAWHYSGSNQWLGLVESIFGGLNQFAGSKTSEFQDLFKSLSSARKILRELESKVNRAQRIVERESNALERAEKEANSAMADHAASVSKPKWVDVQGNFRRHLEEDERLDPKRRIALLDEAGQDLGLAGLPQNAERVHNLLQQAKTLEGRATVLTSSLKARRYVGNVVLGLLGSVLVGAFLFGIAKWYPPAQDKAAWLEGIGKIFAVVSAFGGFIALWFGAMFRNRALKALDALHNFEPTLLFAIREAEQARTYETGVAEAKVSMLRKTVENAQTRLAEATRDLTSAEQAMKDSTEEGVLRLVMEYYREQLQANEARVGPSVVPLIREDFSDLVAALANPPDGSKHPRLDRIIVYVEDLDQCPASDVVSVLQAIVLLLSFPVFVVVVAADPRWLLRSLSPAYVDLTGGEKIRDSGLFALEKIIQMPLWISRIDSRGTASLMRNLMEEVREHKPRPASSPAISPPVMREPEALLSPAGPTLALENRSVESRRFPSAQEIDLMTSLGQYLRNPRRLKRLVNSYSHLRSTLSEMDLHSLLRMDRPAYPAILAELALVIAAPVQASFLFEILAGGRPGTLTDLANDLDSNPEAAETVGNKTAHAILEDYGRRRNDPGAVDELRVWQHRVQRYSFVSPAEPMA